MLEYIYTFYMLVGSSFNRSDLEQNIDPFSVRHINTRDNKLANYKNENSKSGGRTHPRYKRDDFGQVGVGIGPSPRVPAVSAGQGVQTDRHRVTEVLQLS